MSDEAKLKQQEYWRSLEARAADGKVIDPVPDSAGFGHDGDNSWSRRNFLTLMGASLAMAGLASCRRPKERIVPYVQAPEEIVPGNPRQYATAMPLGNHSYGVLVTSHEGRPTKIEGNPLHPTSLGAANVYMQASILDLYDPDRSDSVMQGSNKKSWADFVTFWKTLEADYVANKGEGLAILAEPFAAPTLYWLKQDFLKRFPNATWVTWEPAGDENAVAGMKIAYGKPLRPVYHFDNAGVVLSLDSDFLMSEPDNITSAQGFAKWRRLATESDEMNRLYAVESAHTVTGSMADHRLRIKPSEVGPLAMALAVELKKQGLELKGIDAAPGDQKYAKWIGAVARDLMANRGRCIIVAGQHQAPEVHALVASLNHALGAYLKTFSLRTLENTTLSDSGSLAKLTEKMKAGDVDTLVMLGGNPVFTSPDDLGFAAALKKVNNRIHLSLHRDETSRQCDWHVPMAHFLEAWSDAQAGESQYSVIQPLIEPLHGGKSAVELLNLLASGEEKSGYELVRETWRKLIPNGFDKRWRKTLHDGIYNLNKGFSGTAAVRRDVWDNIKKQELFRRSSDDLELVFTPSHSVYDGRYANNGWLQELPDPVTKLTWDNAALISPATAKEYSLTNGDIVELKLNGRGLEIPVWIVPGQADRTVVLPFGYGRTHAGRVGDEVGINTYVLRTTDAMWFATGLQMARTGRRRDDMANTQDHSSMEGRPIVREATLEEYRKHPEFAKEMVEHPPLVALWDDHDYSKGYQWGMAIDLNACTGCNACVVACQSENNIPVVGREQVHKGREMHWLRIDRYFNGKPEEAGMVYQPVACQHCENAPCEQVCPVAATVHDKEGLNTMVYNRCIGTRYCANNCPYKVRRFNFFNFTRDLPETVRMAQNPDVTVRSRGVMEKCTFCLQRINRTRRDAKLAGREIRDGEVITACQQTCPTRAIVFGNVNDPNSEVSKIKKRNRNYDLLAELNVKPRTSFMAKIRNPNPELEES